MEITYKNVNISKYVDVKSCVHWDNAGEACDLTDVIFENGAVWMGWDPKQGDRVSFDMDGYSTGKLYVHSVLPAGGCMRMLCSSLPAYRQRKSECYENMNLLQIMNQCAAEMGMQAALYGVENYRYKFLLRDDESACAFLERILKMENAALKAENGRLLGIGYEYLKQLEPVAEMELSLNDEGVTYRDENGKRWAALRAVSGCGEATAAAGGEGALKVMTLPATTQEENYRWAKGLLYDNNRGTRQLLVRGIYTPGLTAMGIVNVTGEEAITGRWILQEVEHDFIRQKTTARLVKEV